LDIFRGLCALGIFLSHWHLWSNFTPSSFVEKFIHAFLSQAYSLFCVLTWNTGGHHPSVIGFFILSGFCIHASHCRADNTAALKVNWPAYYQSRAKRIFPVYWLAGVLGLAFVAVQTWRPAANPLLKFHAMGNPFDFFLRLSGLSGLYPKEVLAGNNPLNTVGSELVLYATYPLFLACARRNAWVTMITISLLCQLVLVRFVPPLSPYWVYNSAPMMALFWCVGAWTARWYFERPHRVSPWVFIACWSVFLAAHALPPFHARNLLFQILWCSVCASAVLWLACLEQRKPALGVLPLVRALRHAGQVSYSLYAVHTPVMLLVTWLMLTYPLFQGENYGLQLALTFVASIIATYATYYGIERHYFKSKAASKS
jgi:peptidoglycan/LPS O-acetylase OafA/YrhL